MRYDIDATPRRARHDGSTHLVSRNSLATALVGVYKLVCEQSQLVRSLGSYQLLCQRKHARFQLRHASVRHRVDLLKKP